VELCKLPLDAQQGFLLSRLDDAADLEELAALTGLAPERLQSKLEELVAMGVVVPDGEAGAARSKPEATLTHRSLFEQRLHLHSEAERAVLAERAQEPELSAYCFDPMPKVIQAIFRNPDAGLLQARLVAAHHHTMAGLEVVDSNHAFTGDPGVRQALLQNPVLPASLFRRLWGSRRLQEQYLVAMSHEIPEQTRSMAREVLRASFTQRTADEKAELILKTEGRCLLLLGGVSLDGHTTQLLCRRTYVSTLLIQNIARWSAAPPQLIAHLLRQEVVRRNVQLRLLLERHPNASA
jgi:hypothetical protein